MWLQATHAQLFEPALPTEKQRALQGLSIGTVNKIFVDFSQPGACCHPVCTCKQVDPPLACYCFFLISEARSQREAEVLKGRFAASAGDESGKHASGDPVTAYHLLWNEPWQPELGGKGPEVAAAEQARSTSY